MYRIALLYIGIGEYVHFWEEFYKSMQKNFLRESKKEFFVFTDADQLYGEGEDKCIHRIHQKDLGWPGNTLFRFRMFMTQKEELEKFDYIFFMNANIVCRKEVTEEMFLPIKEQLLVVQHPGYWNKSSLEFPYDRNRRSSAYIPYGKGQVYVCGGINGGKREAYLKLIEELDKRIEMDYNNNIIAKWHDESHINKYIIENTDYRLLSPSYGFPEGWDGPYVPILFLLDKKSRITLDTGKLERKKEWRDVFVRWMFKHLRR